MKIFELGAGVPRCEALSPASPTLHGARLKCQREKGHDKPLPIHDWAHCAICGGTKCKGIGNGSTHDFKPTVTGYTCQPHRFYVDWPSEPATPGENREEQDHG